MSPFWILWDIRWWRWCQQLY